jgi:protein-disulfide isomerase
MANWERKSQYLLREIVKFRTYIDTLTAAQVQKQRIYAEREALEEKADDDDDDDDDVDLSSQGADNDGAKDASEGISPKPMTKQPSTSALLLLP